MESEQKRRIQKPVGIYVLSLLVIVVLGFFQLIRYWIELQVAENLPFMLAFIPLFLCAFTIISGIWLWFGDNWARITFLTFVTLNFLWWFYLVVAVSYSEDPRRFQLIATLIRPGVILGVSWWYLNSQKIVHYFRHNKFD